MGSTVVFGCVGVTLVLLKSIEKIPKPLSSILFKYLMLLVNFANASAFGDEVNVTWTSPLIGAIDQLLSMDGLISLLVEM
ncbi:hypothetical protein D3C76_1537540 [compost metagenome]